ncbi:5-(carboxyamino)imidazole ribonucleotide synthase [Chitinivibrio alkaliphilus]|uniref:N5-carboxyaminoimidazole ribonucleotide synthase n=1 Tax=Chitinivibrio alkaliphilus ACht1 TaxID=1313304 RepID=U7D7M8_9BACT|nr:5-(carboxyamino)imidazole ribonucleotide synthase [Chitinivibrio alkaliphilus]ERP31102.1 phosphoribosylaminoimidazole carboxylase, ATPase subunit [Chitinivibrio alkaliphilus ACht1]
MEEFVTSDLIIGIISGGQLGKMLIQEASKWDMTTYVLDPDKDCPAAQIATRHIEGSNLDFDAVYRFGKEVDLLTFEIENVHMGALKKLKSEGVRIAPDPDVLELIQDKGKQKTFYTRNDIPTAPFHLYESKEQILHALDAGHITVPFVQKLRTGGYDGRGVAVITHTKDLEKLLDGPSVIEEKVAIEKEISLIVARNKAGETATYPLVEMEFDPQENLVDTLFCPASVTEQQGTKAREAAEKIVSLLNMEGLLAVELFIDSTGDVLVNEVAPRTHNSGHHTIESVMTSQFEQHLRAVLNLPLGSTELKRPAVMVNILGEPGFEGPVRYTGLSEALAMAGVKIHLYGKKITRPARKMGHATILATTLDEARKKAKRVQQLIKVTSWKKK